MLLNDVRYALRLLRRSPLFTLTVLCTVALAIGANTAIFSVVNAVMLRPLPFRDPGRLVQIAEKNDRLNLSSFGASVLNFLSWREQQKSFEQIAAVGFATYTLTGNGEPEQLTGTPITPALTRVLGIAPILGRDFSDAEEKPGAPGVAMISPGLWKRRFGGEQSIIGRTILLNGNPTTVVGIAPDALGLINGSDVYTPLTIDPAKEIRLNHVIIVFGRLKSGISLEQAHADMNGVSAHMVQQYPELRDWGVGVITMFDTFVAAPLKLGLLVLLGAVICVLLIASANIANLLLARAATRQKEMAARTALGASRKRLVRQMLVESVMLSGVGGIAGILLAYWGVRAINRALPPNTLPVPAVKLDIYVLIFAAVLTLLTGLLFGIVPALRASKVEISEVLKQGGQAPSGGLRARLRNTLAGAEIALAIVLLFGAGLLIQSLANLQRVHLGFEPSGLITFQLAPQKYPRPKVPLFLRSVIDSLQALPGVKAVAVSSGIPFGAGNYTTSPVIALGDSALPPETQVPIDWRIVSPGYFKAMQVPLLRGREFTDADTAQAPRVVILSQSTAKKLWGDADPLGRTMVRAADRKTAFTVVGVVGDVRNTALNKESPALYYSLAAGAAVVMDVAVRTSVPPQTLLAAIRQKVHELDADLPLANIRTMDEWLANNAAQPRLNTVLLSSFAAIALLIAVMGIYGVLAYSVDQRTREIGLRIALGATPRDVLQQIVGEGMRIVLGGIAIGVACGLALGRVLSGLVYGVRVYDPLIFTSVVIMLAAVALAACSIPATRAARVEPMIALRYE